MAPQKSTLLIVAIGISTVLCCIQGSAQEKRLGRHTVSEWRALVDSLWGPGLPTSTKLEIFDTFWNVIDKQYAGFPYLNLNWDSLKTLYRPEIEAGVSRGRLSAIMGQLFLSLQEIHTWIVDAGIDNAGYFSQHNVYTPGTPLFWPSGWGPSGVFGAALTPLPDSTVIVYKAIDHHPLGLVPGDIILGYGGRPWKTLYKEVASAGFPPAAWGEGRWGSSPRSMTHSMLSSAGNNWGLFDTVDIVKYAAGDTLHLPTGPLTGLAWGLIFGTEQLPVQGVQMPNVANGQFVTYGVLNNTSIGYVYVCRWDAAEGPLFAAALKDLVTVRKVTGLILDFRYNLGSADSDNAADAGFDYLFNENPAGPSRWRNAMRATGSDHLSFIYSAPFDQSVTMKPDFFDRPTAVLTGPQAWSFGDLNPFKMRSHPMVRSFGLPTNGAFVVPGSQPGFGPLWGSWYYGRAGGQMQSLVNNEGFLLHKSFPVDEEVWLTREGVAKGEDDVVKRALEWISTVSYSHDLQLTQVSRDTIDIAAQVENPLSHALTVTVTLRNDQGTILDSLALIHAGGAGNNLWASIFVPPADGTIHASIRTEDHTSSLSRTLTDVAHLLFTRRAIITMDISTWDMGKVSSSLSACDTSFFVRNIGYAKDSLQVSVTEDSSLAVSPTFFTLAPGDSQRITFTVRPSLLPPNMYDAQVFVKSWLSIGQPSFTKTIRFEVVTGVEEQRALPIAFSLGQNYPNPFNPSTTIKYELPKSSQVSLRVYDVLGREVSVLVNEKMNAGVHEVKFEAAGLASGVYFYRIQAGEFVATKKLLLMK
jgi:hypothetical protein